MSNLNLKLQFIFQINLQAGDLIHVPRVDVHHHQLVALRPEDHLLVREPLRAEHLGGGWG